MLVGSWIFKYDGESLKTLKLNAWNEGTKVHSKENDLDQVVQEATLWKDEVKSWHEMIANNGNGL
jgi:hypothetical protein